MMKFIATIAGDCSVTHDIMRCMETICGLFFNIRGHRFATKIVNEKLTKKNTYPLRKSLKSVLIENKNVDLFHFFYCFSFSRCECILNIAS